MQPFEFIDNLCRHYSKRHETEARQIAWTREMIDCVKGNDPAVMQRAYEMIRDEYEQRAFPLPAELKKFITRAAEQLYPDHQRIESSYQRPRIEKWESREFVETCRLARIWQTATIKQFGSWEAYWRSVRHSYVTPGKKPRAPRIASKPPAGFPLSKLRKWRRNMVDVSRPAMEILQRTSQNRHLHVDHSALTRRITGERYE